MYAKIRTTTWDHKSPARSEVSNTPAGHYFEFEHELGCPMQGSTQDCTCYVSRIRLIRTPVGKIIPTTEPDLRPRLRNCLDRADDLRRKAEKLQRENNIVWIGLIITSVSGLTALAGLTFELGLL